MTHFAVPIPQVYPDGTFEPDVLAAYLARAEQLGFESAWVQEHVLGATPVLDPLTTLTFAAAMTSRLRLGCAVFVTSLHGPIQLAKSLASLDQLSRGRLEIGVAAGGPWAAARAFGVEPDTRVARFSEGLQLMKACWTQASITTQGRFWQVDGASMEPKPWQKPHPPLWIGGSGPGALRRAVHQAGGFFGAGSATTADFAKQVGTVRSLLAEAGQAESGMRIAKRVYIAVDDNGDRARAAVDADLLALYGRGGLAPVAVAGTPDDCAEGLRAVIDAGAELVLLNVLRDEAGQIERLAAEVLPHLS